MELLSLVFAPGIAICLYIYYNDRNNKEPISLLLLSFFIGMTCTIPALMAEFFGTRMLSQLVSGGLFYTFIVSFGLVALSAEGCKYLIIRILPYKRMAFDEPFDGIVYTVMVGMGFATFENIGYVYQYGFSTGLLRLFLSAPAQATFAIIMGYYLGLAKFYPKKRRLYYFLAIILPVLFHGAFDFFLITGKTSLNLLGAMVSFLIVLKLSNDSIKKNQEISEKFFSREIGSHHRNRT